NKPPILASIGDKTVDELTELQIVLSATDTDIPVQSLICSIQNAPEGSTFSNGVFQWTPSESQGPGSFVVTFEVSDGLVKTIEEITIEVNEVNVAPVLHTIGAKTVNEGEALTFTASATDADLPANTLTYRLKDAPADATIGETDGVFSWTPGELDGPDTIKFTVIVSDGELEDEEEIEVTINEVNVAPVLNTIGAKSVNEGGLLTFTASATDADLPANTLT